MRIIFVSFLCCILSTGCSLVKHSNRNFDKATNVPGGGVEHLEVLYIEQIEQDNNDESRFKLAELYLRQGRFNEALHILNGMVAKSKELKYILIESAALLSLNRYEDAISRLELANSKFDIGGYGHNLFGIASVYIGDCQGAREHFVEARSNYYNSTAVVNNLALLDVLEGNVEPALRSLSSITDDGGERVYSNMLLALSRSDKLNSFNFANGNNEELIKSLRLLSRSSFESICKKNDTNFFNAIGTLSDDENIHSSIMFEFNSSYLPDDHILDEVVNRLLSSDSLDIVVQGQYYSHLNNSDYNHWLVRRRVERIVEFFVFNGVSRSRIEKRVMDIKVTKEYDPLRSRKVDIILG